MSSVQESPEESSSLEKNEEAAQSSASKGNLKKQLDGKTKEGASDEAGNEQQLLEEEDVSKGHQDTAETAEEDEDASGVSTPSLVKPSSMKKKQKKTPSPAAKSGDGERSGPLKASKPSTPEAASTEQGSIRSGPMKATETPQKDVPPKASQSSSPVASTVQRDLPEAMKHDGDESNGESSSTPQETQVTDSEKPSSGETTSGEETNGEAASSEATSSQAKTQSHEEGSRTSAAAPSATATSHKENKETSSSTSHAPAVSSSATMSTPASDNDSRHNNPSATTVALTPAGETVPTISSSPATSSVSNQSGTSKPPSMPVEHTPTIEGSKDTQKPLPPSGPRPATLVRRKERDQEVEELKAELAAMKQALAQAGLPMGESSTAAATPQEPSSPGELFPRRGVTRPDSAAREAAGKVLASLMDDGSAAWGSSDKKPVRPFRPKWARSASDRGTSSPQSDAETSKLTGEQQESPRNWRELSEEEKVQTLRRRPPGFFVWSTQEGETGGQSTPSHQKLEEEVERRSGSNSERVVPSRGTWATPKRTEPVAAAPPSELPSPLRTKQSAAAPPRKDQYQPPVTLGNEELTPKPTTASFSPSTRVTALSHPCLSNLQSYLKRIGTRNSSLSQHKFQGLSNRERLLSWLGAGAALRLAPASASLLKRVTLIRCHELIQAVKGIDESLNQCAAEADEEQNRAIALVSDIETTAPAPHAIRASIGDLYGKQELQENIATWRRKLQSLGSDIELTQLVVSVFAVTIRRY